MNSPLHTLESLAQLLTDRGMSVAAGLLIEASESIRMELVSMESDISVHDVTEFLRTSNHKLHQDIFQILSYGNCDLIRIKNPGMEEKSAKIAASIILKKGISCDDFIKMSGQVIIDSNDDAILELLDFQ